MVPQCKHGQWMDPPRMRQYIVDRWHSGTFRTHTRSRWWTICSHCQTRNECERLKSTWDIVRYVVRCRDRTCLRIFLSWFGSDPIPVFRRLSQHMLFMHVDLIVWMVDYRYLTEVNLPPQSMGSSTPNLRPSKVNLHDISDDQFQQLECQNDLRRKKQKGWFHTYPYILLRCARLAHRMTLSHGEKCRLNCPNELLTVSSLRAF
jgi:hypothetical protein